MRFTKNSASPGKNVTSGNPFIHVALPVMDEEEWFPRTLACLEQQTYTRFRVVVCVNQPDHWWTDPVKVAVCQRNVNTLRDLSSRKGLDLVLLDHASPGKGWKGKKHGVGQARKVIMDFISRDAEASDLIVSLDADTFVPDNYLASIAANPCLASGDVALAVPYYHRLTGDESADRAILRYEIYMRHYFLNLARIGSPYAFTALGSAMAVPVSSYRAIGGMTPKLSGEDFYFLQKLVKFGRVGLWNEVEVFPAARFSSRVFFGTGPAMIRGAAGDWSSYPLYPDELFAMIAQTLQSIPEFYQKTAETPVVSFLSEIFRESDPWQPLRENHTDYDHFRRAFLEKLDGLRTLQFLKTMHANAPSGDEDNLKKFLAKYYPERSNDLIEKIKGAFSFEKAPLDDLAAIRDFLYDRETEVRAISKPR